MNRIELTASAPLKTLLKSRYPQMTILVLLLAGYVFAIMAGLVGTPVGNSNFTIVFVWIAWWALLILVAVPFLGRGWCSICPIPAPGEWIQRGAMLGPGPAPSRWGRFKWPRPLRNIWLQSGAFVLLALFSTVLLTTPLVTALVLGGMLVLALAMSLLFERRSFCRYICPVGGFIGLYAQASPTELRIKDRLACAACETKPCYRGSPQGYGCPWDVFPGGLQKNTYCGLCLECVRTCPSDNIAINARPFASDLDHPSARLDEAFKSFVMLGAALTYSAVLLGPWGALKDAAFRIGSASWFSYTAAFLATIFILLPGLFALCASPGRDLRSFRQRFARMSAVLIPLGLMAWIAFSLSFVMTNATYIAASLSDPLGIGWNLLGTSDLAWQPLLTAGVAPVQMLALGIGLIWSARVARHAADQLGISAVPALAYCTSFTLVMMWLLI